MAAFETKKNVHRVKCRNEFIPKFFADLRTWISYIILQKVTFYSSHLLDNVCLHSF